MIRHWTSFLSVAALAVLLIGLAPHATAQVNLQRTKYTFVRIADDTGSVVGIGDAPAALNDAGKVAFEANLKAGGAGIFVGDGGPLTTVADTSGQFSFFGFASINGLGQAAFFANKRGGGNGYFVAASGFLTIVEMGGAIHSFGGDVFSSGSGSFSTAEVNLNLPRSAQAIIVGNGGHVTTIADTSGTFATLDFDPNVNGSGQVAFHGIRRDGSEGVFVGKGGRITMIADTSGPFFSFQDSPAISDKGEVLFPAVLKAPDGSPGNTGLFLSSGGKIHTVVSSTGAFAFFGFAPAINAKRQIAFLGAAQSGLVGIFTGDDPKRDRVIAVGDPLDGSTVAAFGASAFRSALNNKGQLAFIAQLADGRTAVYRADPSRSK